MMKLKKKLIRKSTQKTTREPVKNYSRVIRPE
jgi:hypothetical protein